MKHVEFTLLDRDANIVMTGTVEWQDKRDRQWFGRMCEDALGAGFVVITSNPTFGSLHEMGEDLQQQQEAPAPDEALQDHT